MTIAAPSRVRGDPSVAPPRGRRSWAFDAALALLATGAELIALADEGTGVLAIGLAVVAGGALVLRRVAPLAVLATTVAAGVVVVAVGDSPAGASLLIAVYTTAAICELRTSVAALVPTVVFVAVLSAATADTQGRQTSALGERSSPPFDGRDLGARRLRPDPPPLPPRTRAARGARRARTRAAGAARVHEERASIARELHDIVAHSVSVMLVGVRGARNVLRTSPDVAEDTLARVETSGEQSLAELRRILALLRAPEHGADARPQPSLAELDQLDHTPADRALRRPQRPARADGVAARTTHATRARGARTRGARTVQRRDRRATRCDRGDGQEPRRQRPHQARPARPRAGRRFRLRAWHRRRRRPRGDQSLGCRIRSRPARGRTPAPPALARDLQNG